MKTVEEQFKFAIDSVNEYFRLKKAVTESENNHEDFSIRMSLAGKMDGIMRTLEWFGIDVYGNKK